MGMVMYLRRSASAEIARLQAEPGGLEAFMFPDGEDEPADTSLIDFDKAWHALHFTLTGMAYGPVRPLGIIAGEDAPGIGSTELGDPGFWIIEPLVMAEFAAALSAVSDEAIVGRFDPEAMLATDIYLADVFADESDPLIDYLMQGVPALRRFAALCHSNGEGAIRCLA